MKLFIDTKNKVVKIEGSVNFGELIENIKKLLPGEWKEYKLETNTQIQWTNPIVIERWPVYPVSPSQLYPHWWNQPYYGETVTIDCVGTTTDCVGAANGDSLTINMSQQNQYCIEC